MDYDEAFYNPIEDDYYYEQARNLFVIQILKSKLKGNYEDKGYKGREVYLPSPEEIKQRCADLNWMKDQGFSDKFIGNVLQFDYPPIHIVRGLVERDMNILDIEDLFPGKQKRKKLKARNRINGQFT